MILAKSKIMVFISLVLNEYFYQVTRYSCFICGFDLYASLSSCSAYRSLYWLLLRVYKQLG